MFYKLTLQDFISEVAGKEPVPGGGSVSACVGALGTALIEMVTNLTIEKPKYEEVWDEMSMIRQEVSMMRDDLLALIEEDSKSYQVVMDAYKLPKGTEEEKAARSEEIQRTLYIAALTPLNIARKCLEAFHLVQTVLEKGNRNAYSDAKVAAVMLRSAIYGAVFNVRINLESIKDSAIRDTFQAEIESIIKRTDELELKALT